MHVDSMHVSKVENIEICEKLITQNISFQILSVYSYFTNLYSHAQRYVSIDLQLPIITIRNETHTI